MKSLSLFKPALGAILILGCAILIMGCSQDPAPAVSPDDLPVEEPPAGGSPASNDVPATVEDPGTSDK